ncbi:hypothetical protein J2T10_004110 [Paenarthrobacter nicotinovorans]|uniref:Uncharacterized protein n=1 Tax=Paenarthrobacter nicotinovorans TaxID=29320 RepID=A0ABT9TRX6_PAENI|nr:hypothetical protein [Paenarthrobacter nicotinovorans]
MWWLCAGGRLGPGVHVCAGKARRFRFCRAQVGEGLLFGTARWSWLSSESEWRNRRLSCGGLKGEGPALRVSALQFFPLQKEICGSVYKTEVLRVSARCRPVVSRSSSRAAGAARLVAGVCLAASNGGPPLVSDCCGSPWAADRPTCGRFPALLVMSGRGPCRAVGFRPARGFRRLRVRPRVPWLPRSWGR